MHWDPSREVDEAHQAHVERKLVQLPCSFYEHKRLHGWTKLILQWVTKPWLRQPRTIIMPANDRQTTTTGCFSGRRFGQGKMTSGGHRLEIWSVMLCYPFSLLSIYLIWQAHSRRVITYTRGEGRKMSWFRLTRCRNPNNTVIMFGWWICDIRSRSRQPSGEAQI